MYMLGAQETKELENFLRQEDDSGCADSVDSAGGGYLGTVLLILVLIVLAFWEISTLWV